MSTIYTHFCSNETCSTSSRASNVPFISGFMYLESAKPGHGAKSFLLGMGSVLIIKFKNLLRLEICLNVQLLRKEENLLSPFFIFYI